MRITTFAKRNIKELLRDPMSFIFSLALPLFLLIIFQQFKIPSAEYSIDNFTPSIIIFSFSFLSLFIAQLIAQDRKSSLLTRLYATPMKPMEYILGYTLSLLPIILLQIVILFGTGLLLKLKFTINLLLVVPVLLFIALLFIGLGILIGLIASEKSASGIGSVIVQLVAFTSGMYFSSEMVGKEFQIICKVLPFSHSLDITKSIIKGLEFNLLSPAIVFIYIIVVYFVASLILKKRTINNNK